MRHQFRPSHSTIEAIAADVARRRAVQSKAKEKREAELFEYYSMGYRDGREDESKNPGKSKIILSKDGDFPEPNDADLQSLRRELSAFGIDLTTEQVRKLQGIVGLKERAIKKVGQRFPAFYG